MSRENVLNSQCSSWPEWRGHQEFWKALEQSAFSLLMLDYDGTLAGFQEDREQARPYPGVADILNKLAICDRCRVVVVSGRESREVIELLGLQQSIEVWGCHGGQRMTPDGQLSKMELSPEQEQGLQLAENLAKDLGLESGLEIKQGCLAIHWRGRDHEYEINIQQNLEPVWRKLAAENSLRLNYFNAGLELRAKQFSKAHAVEKIWAEQSQPCTCAYLGDDATDEEAFAFLQDKCLGVLVSAQCRPTLAELWLKPPRELLEFLKAWTTACLDQRGHNDQG